MGDAIDPTPFGTLPFEIGEAAPQGCMDLLDEVAPQLRVSLVATRQPLDRRAK